MENFFIYAAIFLGGMIFGALISRLFWKRGSARIGEIYISPDDELFMALAMTVEEMSKFTEGIVFIKKTRR